MIDPNMAMEAGEARDEYIRKHAHAVAEYDRLREGVMDLLEGLKVDAPAYPDRLVRGAYVIERLERILNRKTVPLMRESDGAGSVSAEKALEIAHRFIDGHFANAGKEGPRISIPADPKRDDDIRLIAFIEQAGEAVSEVERLRRALTGLRDETSRRITKLKDAMEGFRKEPFAHGFDISSAAKNELVPLVESMDEILRVGTEGDDFSAEK